MENLNNFNEMNIINSFGKAVNSPLSLGLSKPVNESGAIIFFNKPSEKTDYNKAFLKTVIGSYEELKNVLNDLNKNLNLEIEDSGSVIEYLLLHQDAIEPLKELTQEARKEFEEKLILSYYRTIEGDGEYLNLYVIQDNNKDLDEFLNKISEFNHNHTSRLFMEKSGLIIVTAEFEEE